MSSILKALKKIEKDSPPPQSHPALPKPLAPKQVLNANSNRRRRKFLYRFIVLLVMAVATVMAFSQRRLIIAKMMSIVSPESPTTSNASDSSRINVHRAKVPSPSAKPTPKPPAKKVAPGSRDKKLQASPQSSQRSTLSGTSPSQTASGTRKPNISPNSRVKKPLKKRLPPPDSAPVKKITVPKDTKSTKSVASTKQPAKTRSRETYDRITDSKLKLQALAWSDDAAKRMAVINGRIVHEGESVDGYQVVKIRTEDVIVKEGGKSWRLEFGLRQ